MSTGWLDQGKKPKVSGWCREVWLHFLLCCALLNSMKRLVGWSRAADQISPCPLIESSCFVSEELRDVSHSGRQQRQQHQAWNLCYSCRTRKVLKICLFEVCIGQWLILLSSDTIHAPPAPTVSRSSACNCSSSVAVCWLEWKCEYDSPGMHRYHFFCRLNREWVLAFW